jgi:hypothetical protein
MQRVTKNHRRGSTQQTGHLQNNYSSPDLRLTNIL